MDRTYDIIRLVLSEEDYNCDNYSDSDIPMGCSRIGGPVVDLPKDIIYPEDYYFMAQLNCSKMKQFDKIGLLPESGFLYFFINENLDDGHVYHTSKTRKSLHRVTKKHESVYYYGKIIERFKHETENFSSRYTTMNGIKEWDPFAGEDFSKIYGLYTNCHVNKEDILQFMKGDRRIILLQIGSDGVGEGCTSVSINKKDLINRNFTKCIFEHNQT